MSTKSVKNFRNEGMDRTHNPEFTCMELYVQYKDYNWMMSFTEQLLERICIAVNGTCESVVDGKTINLKLLTAVCRFWMPSRKRQVTT